MTSSSSWSFSSDAAGRMRAGVCTRSPKNNDVVCGLDSTLQYGRTWAERGREGDY
jgi:hypothetical protein